MKATPIPMSKLADKQCRSRQTFAVAFRRLDAFILGQYTQGLSSMFKAPSLSKQLRVGQC